MAMTIQTGTVRELHDYVVTGNARTHRSDAGSQAAVGDAVLAPLAEALERDGYAVLPDLLDGDRVAEIRAQLAPHFRDGGGRNLFEGLKTRRIYGLVEKAPASHALAEHPLVLGLLDRVLEPNYLLSQLQAIDILPGEATQPLHHDDGFYPVPRPRPPLGAATILALGDFTAENGATRVIPGSHLWDGREPSPEEAAAAVPVAMPAGSAVIFLGTLWHGGGGNDSGAPRLALTAQYCAPWCRQQENYSLSVSLQTARACSPHMQRLLGYSIHAPFMGMVDGMHPRRLLEG
ncbi:phytanoyl-CoA dioxygenase family protein [Marinibaculum pumilum]|uniref:Phytanoyl-CoA dioxygenase family protein n=1 Tax=Marinibaculum pumilum TaxID=1766165 RepID=A0ABV7L4J6_9PROT